MGKIKRVLEKISGQNVYIDTNLFIYFLDQNTIFFPIASRILEAAELGVFIAFTGDLTIAEALVKPYKSKNTLLIEGFKDFFYAEDFLTIKSHNSDIFDLSSQIRAQHNMKFADALHYATAIKSGCTFFITNDKGIRSTDELEVILIQDLMND